MYIIVITEANILYRLNFPLSNERYDDWCEEWTITEPAGEAWTMMNENEVVLAAADGIVRCRRRGGWTVQHHRLVSRFKLFSGTEEIISLGHSSERVYTLSRERLRLWVGGGVAKAVDIQGSTMKVGNDFVAVNSGSRVAVFNEDLGLMGEYPIASLYGAEVLDSTLYLVSDDAVNVISNNESHSAQGSINYFDAAYFDAITQEGDISALFISHLFHPGRFSQLALTATLSVYEQHLPRPHLLPQLSAAYPSLAKNYAAVVGCTLEMQVGRQTGAPMVEGFRKDLKREWLGIWAIACDLDKQARWPVGTVVVDGQFLVVTREGISAVVADDLQASAVSKAGAHIASVIDLDEFTEQLNAVLAAPPSQPVELLAGSLWDEYVEQSLSEDNYTTVRRLLSDGGDVETSLNDELDALGSLGDSDGDDGYTDLGTDLVTDTLTDIILTRYALSRDILLAALFHLSERRDDDAEDLIIMLSRSLATYHRWRILRWVSEQTSERDRLDIGGLKMGEKHDSSLLASLVKGDLPIQFVDAALAWLRKSFPEDPSVEPSSGDVWLAYSMLDYGAAGHFTTLCPLSAGMAYVRGRAYLDIGDIDEAIRHLQLAAAGVGKVDILPTSINEYYHHVTRLCEGRPSAVVYLGQLAIASAPDEKECWTKVFLAHLALTSYEAAYETLAICPHPSL